MFKVAKTAPGELEPSESLYLKMFFPSWPYNRGHTLFQSGWKGGKVGIKNTTQCSVCVSPMATLRLSLTPPVVFSSIYINEDKYFMHGHGHLSHLVVLPSEVS